MNYQDLFKGLNNAGVDYLVAGGLAVNLHGVPRMTYDVDLMIDLREENIRLMLALLGKWGYRPQAPVDPEDFISPVVRQTWKQEKNMRAFTFIHESSAIGEIDLLFDAPVDYGRSKGRAALIRLGDIHVPVIGVRDLIEMKENSGRLQDRQDAEALRRAMGAP